MRVFNSKVTGLPARLGLSAVCLIGVLVGGMAGGLAGCQSGYQADQGVAALLDRGQTSRARVNLAMKADAPEAGRERLLYEQQAMHAALLDGLPANASRRVEYVYDTLRTQGVNANNNADPFFVNEQSVRFWKGEPYEQAMALSLVAIADMTTGRWGNARAAAIESLGRLNAGDDANDDEFVLGRLLAGVANRQLGREQEAGEHFEAARQAAARIGSLADELEHGQYDAVLMVEAGRCPSKTATGTDLTEIVFRVRTPTDTRGLVVHDAGGSATWPWVTDLNAMAGDHRWAGLDEGRRSKSAAGTVLTAGGVGVAASSDKREVQAAGLGAAIIGLIAKANAQADTRYDELLPQRVYLVPIKIGSEPPTLEIENSSITLRPLGLRPREDGRASAVLVRMPESSGSSEPQRWADSGRVWYANDVSGSLAEPTLPWILGGRGVRTPRRTLMSEYRLAGMPESISYEDLIELYRAEGIEVLRGQDRSRARGHILEGGSTLYTPTGGSLGFTRLFGVDHGEYEPTSSVGRAMRAAIREHTP